MLAINLILRLIISNFLPFEKKSEPPLTEEANYPSSKNAQLLSLSGSISVPHDD